MPHLVWSEDFMVGIPEVDDEHRRLVDACNRVHDAFWDPDARASVGPTLRRLIDDMERHAAIEEALLAANGAPRLEEHRNEHAALVRELSAYLAAFGPSREFYAVQFIGFLGQWLQLHILEIDKPSARYLLPLATAS